MGGKYLFLLFEFNLMIFNLSSLLKKCNVKNIHDFLPHLVKLLKAEKL